MKVTTPSFRRNIRSLASLFIRWTWVTTYNTTCVNPEDPDFIFRRREHFIFQVVFIVFIFLVLFFQIYACKAKLGKGVCVFRILKHSAYRHMKKLPWTYGRLSLKTILYEFLVYLVHRLLPSVYFSNVTRILQQDKKKEQTRLERKRGHRIEEKENHWNFVTPAPCLALPMFVLYLMGRSFVSLFHWYNNNSIYWNTWLYSTAEMLVQVSFIYVLKYQINSDENAHTCMYLREADLPHAHHPKFARWYC